MPPVISPAPNTRAHDALDRTSLLAGRMVEACPWALPGSFAVVLALTLVMPGDARAQRGARSPLVLLEEVMPSADRFTGKQGSPPVFRGYRLDPVSGEQVLVGYAFLTSDLPPEELGYSGPIEALVGMDLEGTLTGVRVMRYREAFQRIYGDFLRVPGFQEQFAGKHIADPFRVYRDVDGISRATISVSAMARGIRNAARRVAQAYLQRAEPAVSGGTPSRAGTSSPEEQEGLSWPQMITSGLVAQIVVSSHDLVDLELSFAHIGDEAVGNILLGPNLFDEARQEAEARARGNHIMLLGLDGTLMDFFEPQALAIAQGTDTVSLSRNEVVLLGAPWGGKIDGQVQFVGILLVDRTVDMTGPFRILYDLRPGMGLYSPEFSGSAEVPALEQEPAVSEAARAPAGPVADTGGVAPEVGGAVPEAAPTAMSFNLVEEETVFSRTLAQTSWTRFVRLLLLLGFVTSAFLSKRTPLRWAALTATLLFLGFVDGGFLSVSHISSGITVGPTVYLNDLPLLLIVAFTVVTTLLWGRVLCGFLCPFGALQDFLGQAIPRRHQLRVPARIHDRALYVKFVVLALVLAPALTRSQVTLFQYFEPFGTVFYLSPSVVLWIIAVGFLAGSAVVPRLYCRYVCPLGAALALASLLSPFRIGRVQQCDVCEVCERSCPTAAIRGSDIDFKECVRCNICEIKLRERAGVCRHNAEEARPRPVTLKVWAR